MKLIGMDQQENVTETLSGTMWLEQSPPPPYQRLSPTGRQDGRNLIVPQQVNDFALFLL